MQNIYDIAKHFDRDLKAMLTPFGWHISFHIISRPIFEDLEICLTLRTAEKTFGWVHRLSGMELRDAGKERLRFWPREIAEKVLRDSLKLLWDQADKSRPTVATDYNLSPAVDGRTLTPVPWLQRLRDHDACEPNVVIKRD